MSQGVTITDSSRGELGDAAIFYGLPFVVLSIVSILLFAFARFDFQFAQAHLVEIFLGCLQCVQQRNRKRIAAVLALIFTVCIVGGAVLLLVLFAASVAANVDPSVISPVLVCCSVFLVSIVLAVVRMSFDQWKLSRTAIAALLVGVASVIAALACILVMIDNPRSFVGTSFVFLTVNFCIVAYLVHQLQRVTTVHDFAPRLQAYREMRGRQAAESVQSAGAAPDDPNDAIRPAETISGAPASPPPASTNSTSQPGSALVGRALRKAVPNFIAQSRLEDEELDRLTSKADESRKSRRTRLGLVYGLNLLVLAGTFVA